MHAVLRLVKHDGGRGFKHLVRHFHLVDSEFFRDFPADAGVQVVEGRQAVHKYAVRCGCGHLLRVHLIGGQLADALLPHLGGLAHGDPYVGVDHVRTLDGLHRILAEGELRAGLGGDLLALFDQRRVGEVLLRGAGHELQAHLRAAHHQGVAHVVARVAHVHQLHALKAAKVFADGQEIGKNLGGMELVGQAVPHRHARVLRQRLHDLLAEAAVLDAVVHAAQHPRGVGDGFLLADLGAGGVEIGHAHAQIVGRDLEAAAGAGAGLFKDQRNVLAAQRVVGDVRLLLLLELRRQIDQRADLLGRQVQQLQEALSRQGLGVRHAFQPPKHSLNYYKAFRAPRAMQCR